MAVPPRPPLKLHRRLFYGKQCRSPSAAKVANASLCGHGVRAAPVRFGQRKGKTKKSHHFHTAESVSGPASPPFQARQPTPRGRPATPPSSEFVLGPGPAAARQGTESNLDQPRRIL